MRLKNFMAGVASLALVASPALAANPAASLSVAPSSARASADAGESNLSAPGSIFGLVLAAAIVGAGIYLAVDGNSNDRPASR